MSRIRQEQIRSETAPSGYVLVSDGDGNVNWGDILNITTLDEISDVSLVTVVSGEVLTYNGAEWINSNISVLSSGITTLDELNDVEILIPTSGQGLYYNGIVWINTETTTSGVAEGDHGLLTGLSDNDHPQYQLISEKGIASGYASLDSSIRLPTAQLGSGVADSTSYLRGDRTWQAITVVGQYRQFLYVLDGLGDFMFLTDADGNPLMGLMTLE